MDSCFFSSLTEGDFEPSVGLMQSTVEGDFEVLGLRESDGAVRGQYAVAEFQDSDCVLLLHFDGADGATETVDSGPTGHDIAEVGSFQLDTAQKVFGTASGYFTTNSDRLIIGDHADFNFGSGAFTISARVRFETLSNINLFSQNDLPVASVDFAYSNSSKTISFIAVAAGVDVNIESSVLDLAIDTWYTFAVTRSGNDYKIFLDGEIIGSGTDTDTLPDAAANLVINVTGAFRGWLDEYIVIKGRAEYTAAYTPPTQAYGEGAYLLYQGTDTEPDFSGAADETFYTLPHTTAAVAADHDYYNTVRYKNKYGLESQNTESEIIYVAADGSEAGTPPSAPEHIEVAAAAGGTVNVQAIYLPQGDGVNAADTWLIYATDTGVDPDPAVDSPTEVAMTDQRTRELLDWDSGAYADGADIRVLVRTRRSGTPDVDSTNVTIYSATANTDGPATPTANIYVSGYEKH